MTKHKLKELRNLTVYKENIISNVKSAIYQEPEQKKRKWTYQLVTIAVTCALLFFIVFQVTQHSNITESTANDIQLEDFMEQVPFPASTEILYTTEQDGDVIVFYQDESGFRIGYKLDQVDDWNHTGNGEMAPLEGFSWVMNNNATIPHVMFGGMITDASITQVVVKQRTVQQEAAIINKGDYKLWFTQFDELKHSDPSGSGDPLKIEAYNADGALIWRQGIYENGFESGRMIEAGMLDVNPLVGLFKEQVDGVGITYGEYFKIPDQRIQQGYFQFYKPIKGFEAMKNVAMAMDNVIHPIAPEKFPFEANIQDVFAVSLDTKENHIQNHLQFTYMQKTLSGQAEQFAIFSVINMDNNPLAIYSSTHETVDFLGNKWVNEGLVDEYPLLHQVITTDRGVAYRYYDADGTSENVNRVSTSANEIYTYYNGYLFHVGYQLDNMDQEEVQLMMVEMVKEFVLGNEL